ncbi:peptide deformylase 1B, chloroplastic [Olea europaea subsp. europaea]|uniref:Peptide deformylase n=1 Tax=Olea europaea subsp. europaea TaxID=158383 RepID=A0A8S0SX24_OLEEU|nr:peptide deformylase 1B, chloroplastic [Olea europaea subsp. europaea]
MAAATWLHSSAPSNALRPFLRRTAALLRPNYRRIHQFTLISPITFSSEKYKPLEPLVRSRARRNLSSMIKDDEVASPDDLHFEGQLKVVEYPDPILRARNKRINSFDDSLKKLADEMFDVMYRTDGIGLSAPQVGINVQLMVFNPVGERGEGEEIVLVNPRVDRYSRKLVLYNEGCLSFPGIYADVERPDSLKVDAQDVAGARFKVNLSGLPARVFQHEYDHLQGILFFDKMSDEVLDSIREDLQAMEKRYEEKTGFPSPERIDARQRRKAAVGFGKS